jgi:glutamate--cysteine ligase
MAVTEVYSGDEVLNFNKKNRNKMNAIKGSVVNNRVIIQEGIATIDLIDNKPAEPLIYLLNSEVIANLFRFNVNEDSFSNLNNAGAAFIDSDNILENQYNLFSSKNDVDNINKFIAKLASLASAIEAAKLQDNLLN